MRDQGTRQSRAFGKTEYTRGEVRRRLEEGHRVLVCSAAGDLAGHDWLDLGTTANHDPGDEDRS